MQRRAFRCNGERAWAQRDAYSRSGRGRSYRCANTRASRWGAPPRIAKRVRDGAKNAALG